MQTGTPRSYSLVAAGPRKEGERKKPRYRYRGFFDAAKQAKQAKQLRSGGRADLLGRQPGVQRVGARDGGLGQHVLLHGAQRVFARK